MEKFRIPLNSVRVKVRARVRRLRLGRVMVRYTFSTKSGIPCIRIGLGLRVRGGARGLTLGRVIDYGNA
jgi:hypothetical protein